MAAVLDVGSAHDKGVAALPLDSGVGVARLVGFEVEVAMQDLHRQRNSDKDWAA